MQNKKVLQKITELVKESLSEGEDSEGNILGFYSKVTEIIALNPSEFGVPNPIKPKVAGEPYNLQWAGNLFNSIIARQIELASYQIDAESEFLDGRNEEKIINLQEKQKEEVVLLIDLIYGQFINDYFA